MARTWENLANNDPLAYNCDPLGTFYEITGTFPEIEETTIDEERREYMARYKARRREGEAA